MSYRSAVLGAAASLAVLCSAFAALADDPVVAVVNGEKILKSDVVEAQQNLPREYQALPMEQIYPALLTSLIDSKLVAADARKNELNKDPAFQAQLQQVTDQLLERFAVRQVIEKALTDEKLRARYDAKYAGGGAQEIKARHILLKTNDDAVAVIKELNGGADFATLAEKRSTGPSAPQGGDLGYFGEGQMVPEFEQAAFALDKGAYTKEPVKTQFGFHVILVEDKRKAPAPTFEESAEELRQELAQEAGAKYVDQLRETAKIERFKLDGSK